MTKNRFVPLACVAALIAGLAAVPTASAQRLHVYRGQGTITAVDTENDTITVDFSSVNRALRNALGGELSDVEVAIGDDTEFSLDGLDPVDTSDLCSSGDTARIVIRTPDRLSGHDLTDHPADEVVAESPEGGCGD